MSLSSNEIEEIAQVVLRVIDEHRPPRMALSRRARLLEWIKEHPTIPYATAVFLAVVLAARFHYGVEFETIAREVSRDYTEAQARHDLVQQHLELGQDFLKVDNVEAARAEFKEALALEPTNLEVQRSLFLANTFEPVRTSGEFDPEVVSKRLEFLSREDPDDPILSAMLGDVYREKGNYDDAIKAYERAVEDGEFEPIPRAYFGLGMIRRLQGDYSEALYAFNVAAVSSPDNPVYVSNYAAQLSHQGRWREALARIKKLEKLNPSFIFGYLYAARILRTQALYPKAIEQLKKTIALLSDKQIAGLDKNKGEWFFSVNPASASGKPKRSKLTPAEIVAQTAAPEQPNLPQVTISSNQKKLYYAYLELALTSYLQAHVRGADVRAARPHLKRARRLQLPRGDVRDVHRLVRDETLWLEESLNPLRTHQFDAFRALLR